MRIRGNTRFVETPTPYAIGQPVAVYWGRDTDDKPFYYAGVIANDTDDLLSIKFNDGVIETLTSDEFGIVIPLKKLIKSTLALTKADVAELVNKEAFSAMKSVTPSAKSVTNNSFSSVAVKESKLAKIRFQSADQDTKYNEFLALHRKLVVSHASVQRDVVDNKIFEVERALYDLYKGAKLPTGFRVLVIDNCHCRYLGLRSIVEVLTPSRESYITEMTVNLREPNVFGYAVEPTTVI